jgi:hypothetical protein
MKRICLLLGLIFLTQAFEFELEGKDEVCLKFKTLEIEGSMSFDAVSSGFNNKLVIYKILNEQTEVITERRKSAEFHYTINQTKLNEIYRFCVKDLDGTKKNIYLSQYERATISSKPVQKDSFESLRSLSLSLLEKLRKIEQGIRFRETLASNHIDLTTRNLDNIKYGSLAKVLIVALITMIEIFILMKFVEKRERVIPR